MFFFHTFFVVFICKTFSINYVNFDFRKYSILPLYTGKQWMKLGYFIKSKPCLQCLMREKRIKLLKRRIEHGRTQASRQFHSNWCKIDFDYLIPASLYNVSILYSISTSNIASASLTAYYITEGSWLIFVIGFKGLLASQNVKTFNQCMLNLNFP